MREKTRRNSNIRKLHTKHGGSFSYEDIRKKYRFKSRKTIWRIVNKDIDKK